MKPRPLVRSTPWNDFVAQWAVRMGITHYSDMAAIAETEAYQTAMKLYKGPASDRVVTMQLDLAAKQAGLVTMRARRGPRSR